MNRIRELRKRKKMTQKELAEHLRIADSTLSYWEMGRYEPDNESLLTLSKFFHVSIEYLLGGGTAGHEPDKEGILYKDAGKRLSYRETPVVRESEKTYEADRKHDDSDLFDREEFEDLTKEEIDRLAQYAAFMKSLREKERDATVEG